MSTGDAFCRHPEHDLERLLQECIKQLQTAGLGGNIVKDDEQQLSPPEYATWTGGRLQLALCRNGRNVWLEVREFRKNPSGGNPLRVAIRQVCDRGDFATTVGYFCTHDTEA